MISYWSSPLARVGVWEAGGMNVYISGLSQGLIDLGHKVDIYTKSPNCKEIKITNVVKNLRVIHIPIYGNLYAGVPTFTHKIEELIQKENISYDVFHSHYFYSGLIVENLKKDHIPWVHNSHSYGILKAKTIGIIDKKRIKYEKEIFQRADALIVSTYAEREVVLEEYPKASEKIYLISPGIDHNIFKPLDKYKSRQKLNLSRNKIYILFVGRIDPVKGIPSLITAVQKLLQSEPNLKSNLEVLLIGGDISSKKFWKQKEVKMIKDLIQKVNLSGNIRFLGSRSNTVLPYYYSACDIVVLPSVYESFGLVVLEAMACRACVVASKAGGPEYLIQDGKNGLLFDRENTAQLNRILKDLIHNPGKREKIGKNAVTRSFDFCWSTQAEKVVSLYGKMMKRTSY